MSSPLNFSIRVSLALHAMALLAATGERHLSTKQIAETLHASPAHTSKILQRLSISGLVKSVSGPSGGFRLAKEGTDIRLTDVYEAIEGPLTTASCLFNNPVCNGNSCLFGDILQDIDRQLQEWLAGTTLADLTANVEPTPS